MLSVKFYFLYLEWNNANNMPWAYSSVSADKVTEVEYPDKSKDSECQFLNVKSERD
jgi:hypothetical protein